MIQETSKEKPVELDILSGLVAFIGNINDCSNYAGRFAKTNRLFDWSNGLSTQIELDRPVEPIGLMYYLGEFFNNTLPSKIREGTQLIVIVDDHIDRRNATSILLAKIAPDIKVQILQAKTSTGITPEQKKLNETDKFVIRELERMFLKDTSLNIEREQLRINVDSEDLVEEEEPMTYEHPDLSLEEIALLDSGLPTSVAVLLTEL
jgi:hypothetical protein